MNGTAAKAARRQMRRAMGEHAVDQVETHTTALQQVQSQLAELQHLVARQQKEITAAHNAVIILQSQLDRVRDGILAATR